MKEKIKWSVMIPTFNCAQYVAKTLSSVLEQDLGDQVMQIEVIDDCSSDNIEEVIKKFGNGRVTLYKQTKNVGHVKNFETALKRAQGEIVHLLHGDDYVLPGFYTKMDSMYNRYPEIGACYSRHFFVDEENNITHISELRERRNTVLTDFHKVLIYGQRIQTPSITVKKEVYNRLGNFNEILSWTEDWEMWVRISKNYPMGYISEPLACYRVHSNSSTGNKALNGENIKDLLRIKKLFKQYIETNEESVLFEKTFRHIIFENANRNYNLSKKVNYENAYLHLLTMAKYAPNFKIRLKQFIKYLIKKYGY